jgi:hypothetical protein
MEDNSQYSEVYKILSFVVSTVVLVTLGMLFYQVRWLFYLFALLSFLCVLAVMLDFTIRRLTRLTYRDIGQFSTVGQDARGKVKTFKPLGIAAPGERSTKGVPVIPKVSDMLAQELLDGVTLYLGYTITEEKVEPYTGTFNDVRTFAIAGKGGSGKTVRLFFLLLQCILAHATVYLCDPHGDDSGSITGMLEPLSSWIKCAVTDFRGDIEGQIMNAVVAFRDTMERRVHGLDKSRTPQVLAVDEVTRMIFHEVYGADFVDICCKVADEYRKFGGYLIVVGQSWTAAGRGKKVTDLLARLKRALHAKFVHRLDKEYAKYFFTDSKLLRRIDHLPTRQCFFFDTEGQFHELYTPYGTVSDAITVARMMQAIESPTPMQQITEPEYTVQQLPEQIAFHYPTTRPLETNPAVTPYSPLQQLPEHAFMGAGEDSERVNKPAAPGESGLNSHGEQVNGHVKPGETVKPGEEQAILRAYFLLEADKPGQVTRGDILARLGWNNKKWSVLKAVCDKYGIAC